ncbi:MAG: hypothetical protein ACYC0F_20355, partial [Rhodanobacter sp.]
MAQAQKKIDLSSYGEAADLSEFGTPEASFSDQLLDAVPDAARMAGGLVGGTMGAGAGLATGPGAPVAVPALTLAGGVMGAEMFGQAADIAIDYIRGRSKSGAQRAREAVSNM